MFIMQRFGKMHVLRNNLTFFGKIGYFINGIPDIGAFLRFLYFKKYVSKVRKKVDVLDAGCGGGDYSLFLINNYSLINHIDAIDINQDEINKNILLFKNYPSITFKKQDLQTLNYSRSKYDLIYSIDCLEHIPNNKQVLKSFYALLNPQGILLVHLPLAPSERLHYFNSSYFKKFNEFEKNEHVGEFYYPEQLKEVLMKIGFVDVKYSITFGYCGQLSWELDHLLIEKKWFKLRTLLVLPLKAICFVDRVITNKKGSGIFIQASK
jgi:ubiquinone/menaquinone biosynthesis C-methylase UbiE